MEDLRPTQWIIMASGAVMFLFSFLDQFSGDDEYGNAWSEFGLMTFPALFGLLAIGVVLLGALGNSEMPTQVLGLRIAQYLLVLGVTAILVLIGFWRLTRNVEGLGVEVSVEAGFWLSGLGSIGLFVGAFLDDRGAPTNSAAAPPTPF